MPVITADEAKHEELLHDIGFDVWLRANPRFRSWMRYEILRTYNRKHVLVVSPKSRCDAHGCEPVQGNGGPHDEPGEDVRRNRGLHDKPRKHTLSERTIVFRSA